jgi:hypothetical protein
MENKRDSCIFYRSFYEAISDLTKEQQADVYNAIFEYTLNFNHPELLGISKTVFTLIKPQLDANNKRFENGSKPKQKQNRSKTEANNKQTISETQANYNVNDNVNNNINYNNNKKFSFKQSLLDYGFTEQLISDWLKVRKEKKASNTETAYKNFISEIQKRECDINNILEFIVSKSWSGFKWEWYDKEVPQTITKKSTFVSCLKPEDLKY